MNIVFMGTPDFAVPCLRRLVEDGHACRWRSPSRINPRAWHRLTAAACQGWALASGIPGLPARLHEDGEACGDDRGLPGRILSWWWRMVRFCRRRILAFRPKAASTCTRRFCRGIGGRPLFSGRCSTATTETGVTTMRMEAGLDTGICCLRCRRPFRRT